MKVERRPIPAHGSIVVHLPFPPATRETASDGEPSHAHEAWRTEAHEAISVQRPRCASGPVEICVTLEDRSDFRAFDHLSDNILKMLVRSQIISGAHSRIVRRLTLQFGTGRGAKVEISPLPIARAA